MELTSLVLEGALPGFEGVWVAVGLGLGCGGGLWFVRLWFGRGRGVKQESPQVVSGIPSWY